MADPLEEDAPPVDEIAQALERGFEPGRWWQANDREGNMLAETSSPSDFAHLGLFDRPDVTFFRQYVRQDTEWVKEDPSAFLAGP